MGPDGLCRPPFILFRFTQEDNHMVFFDPNLFYFYFSGPFVP